MTARPLRSAAVTARVGVWLAVAVAVCFVTRLFSHFLRYPQPRFFWPTRPAWLCRFTEWWLPLHQVGLRAVTRLPQPENEGIRNTMNFTGFAAVTLLASINGTST
jgi:hypothetical protein